MRIKKKQIFIIVLTIIIINVVLNYNFFIASFNNNKELVYDTENVFSDVYEINDIDKKVNMIYILFDYIPTKLTIEYKNDDFLNYKHFNPSYTNDKISQKALYVYMAVDGKINDLKFNISNGKINKIILNPKIKYQPYLFKTILLSAIAISLLYVFKNNKKLDFNDKKQQNKTFIILLIICIIFIAFGLMHYKRENNMLYYLYTDAIVNKSLEIPFIVDEKLLDNPNPYDTSNRDYDFLWDATYYKGKYYCYFGIWPILIALAPAKLLFGSYVSITYLSFLFSVASVIVSYLLYKEIIKKYFNDITYNTFILSFIYIIFGSKLLWCMHRSDFYELVSIAAYFHIILGLYLVLFNNKNNVLRDFFGYTSLALAVLCRPTSLLLSIMIVPKLITRFKNKELKTKNIIALVIPYLIVGLFTMYINYIRFESIFEFGITYQLTTSNLINNHFSLLRCFIGLFYYFIGPFKITIFPFSIVGIKELYPIISDFNVENIGGGIINTSILGVILFFTPWIIKIIREKDLRMYLIMSLIIGMILCMLSSGMIALIGRYMLDFNYLFYFVIIALSLIVLEKDKSKILHKIFIICLVLSIVINYFISLTNVI